MPCVVLPRRVLSSFVFPCVLSCLVLSGLLNELVLSCPLLHGVVLFCVILSCVSLRVLLFLLFSGVGLDYLILSELVSSRLLNSDF